MKLTINVEIDEREIPVATTLLSVLHQLAAYVKVTNNEGALVQQQQQQQQIQQQQIQQQQMQQQQMQQQQMQQMQQQIQQQQIQQQQQQQLQQLQQQQLQKQQLQQQQQHQQQPQIPLSVFASPEPMMVQPASSNVAALPSPVAVFDQPALADAAITTDIETEFEKPTMQEDPVAYFRALLKRYSPLSSDEQLEEVANELQVALDTCKHPNVMELFFPILCEVAFNVELVRNNRSTVPYIMMIGRLSENWCTTIRDSLVSVVLKALTTARSIECERGEFFSFAEAFAALVKLELLPVTGAVRTAIQLIKKPQTRSAGIAMLGTTTEHCLALLKEKCDPPVLDELQAVLKTVKDKEFDYDIDYIEKSMRFSLSPVFAASPPAVLSPGPTPELAEHAVAVAAAPGLDQLTYKSSFHGHSAPVFAIAYDQKRDLLVSGDKDGALIVWTPPPQQALGFSDAAPAIDKMTLSKHYACSVDINSNSSMIYLCGVKNPLSANTELIHPAIICYQLNATTRKWSCCCRIVKKEAALFSCVKALTGDSVNNEFLVGESFGSLTSNSYRVCLYDSTKFPNPMFYEPVATYAEHTDVVTTLTECRALGDGAFFSGSRDCTVKMWDKRTLRSAVTLGGAGDAQHQAHTEMVTCVTSFDHILVSGSMDRKVLVWDVRKFSGSPGATPLLQSLPIGDRILKMALGPKPTTAAVCTLKSLYFVDLLSGQKTLAVTPDGDSAKPRRYHDLKWNRNKDVLFAAREEKSIDLFVLPN